MILSGVMGIRHLTLVPMIEVICLKKKRIVCRIGNVFVFLHRLTIII